MDYKNMTDAELAAVIVNYINRVKHLKDIIGRYLDGSDHACVHANQIRAEYRKLKAELREDAHYLYLVHNRNGSVIYRCAFAPSIREAAAFGFTVPVNTIINQKMYSAVEEAHYKLRKYRTLEQWGALM